MNDQSTINDRVAETLGDARGSYELLIARRICEGLGVDPAFRGQLSPSPTISTGATAWLRHAADGQASDAAHANEILAALQL